MSETRNSLARLRSNGQTYTLKMFGRNDSNTSTASAGSTTAHEDDAIVDNWEPLLEAEGMELRKRTSPELEAETPIVGPRKRWYHSPAWLFCAVLLFCLILLQNAYLLASCGYEAYLKPSINLYRTRFAGAIRATANGNRMHVPEPALDDQGRRYTGPPSPNVDAAWHHLIYGRYVNFTASEVSTLNSDVKVPSLLPLPITADPKSHNLIVPQEGYYGGPDMLHSLHCINGLRKHLDMDYYRASMPAVPKEYERMHIDHCLEQLRQAVLCHGDLTPVTLRPVRNETGQLWALLGETEREHVCRNGEELARMWRERGADGGRVETE